jgi:hypothetical protein
MQHFSNGHIWVRLLIQMLFCEHTLLLCGYGFGYLYTWVLERHDIFPDMFLSQSGANDFLFYCTCQRSSVETSDIKPHFHVRFEILIAVTVNNMAFWNMAMWEPRWHYVPEYSIFHQIFMCVGYHVFSTVK